MFGSFHNTNLDEVSEVTTATEICGCRHEDAWQGWKGSTLCIDIDRLLSPYSKCGDSTWRVTELSRSTAFLVR